VTRFSVGLPQMLAGGDDARSRAAPRPPVASVIVPFARRAEELGFDGLWTMDSAVGGPTGHAPTLDGLQVLAAAAAVTSAPRLGIAVIVMPRRQPALLAKELASLDVLSGGRLTVGVGIGSSQPPPAEMGFPTGGRARRLREGVELMRALWEGGQVAPRPVQRPGPPIWFGAGAPVALHRAARLGDGWIGGGSSSTEDFAGHVETLRAAGIRDDFAIAKRVYIAVEDTEARARELLTPALDGMYGAPGMTDRVAVCGPPEHCRAELERLIDAGAQELVLNPLYGHAEQLEALAGLR
jgi:alkanesulfonate monooxygenase SsuD/methylene tetrahydromethanopterin reductase-like flavin-dependent oxidoreductase (luciferase family)